ncbi:hypothetical protein TPS_05981 [Trichinella pseudospiralis]
MSRISKRKFVLLDFDDYEKVFSSYQVDHMYYTMHIYKPDANRMKDFWISIPDLIKKNSSVRGKVRHAQLSNSYRKAVSQPLSFKFPFYGHIAQNITIATGGFVYVGEYIHHWLAATQYIAPLMANFDTTVNEESSILYVDTGYLIILLNSIIYTTEKLAIKYK